MTGDPFLEAFETRDIERFLKLVFPPTWQGLAARIIETGVTFSTEMCAWAPQVEQNPADRARRPLPSTAVHHGMSVAVACTSSGGSPSRQSGSMKPTSSSINGLRCAARSRCSRSRSSPSPNTGTVYGTISNPR